MKLQHDDYRTQKQTWSFFAVIRADYITSIASRGLIMLFLSHIYNVKKLAGHDEYMAKVSSNEATCML